MTTFYLIRHAEREGSPDLLAGKMPGLHLTPGGRALAERIATRLAAEQITRVFSSPLERTRETAAPLAQQKRVPVEISDAIGEIDAGEFTGRKFGELEQDPHWRGWNQLRSIMPLPGGDAIVDVQARFVREMLRLSRECPDTGVALVSHADPIRAALSYFLGSPLDVFERIEIGLGSISVVTLAGWGVRVLRVNDVP